MKKWTSLLLAVVLLVGMLPLGSFGFTANAAVVVVDTISEGQTWHKSWTAADVCQTVALDVTKSDFYQFTATDHKQTGWIGIVLFDVTYGTGEDAEFVDSYFTREVGSFVSDSFWLDRDCKYEIECYYFDMNTVPIAADMSIVFNKSTVQLPAIPTCDVTASNLRVQFTEEDNEQWLQYTPASTGDYRLDFEDLHAYVSVYDTVAQEYVYYDFDTEYYDDDWNDWYTRDCAVFSLVGGRKYYVHIQDYSSSSSRLSMGKMPRTLKTITIDKPLYSSFSPFDNIDDTCFSYKLTYTDNTSVTSWLIGDIEYCGYRAPYVYYNGEKVDFYDYEYEYWYWYPVAGTQPVVCGYNGFETTAYVTITAFTDWLIDMDASPVGENDHCALDYETEDIDIGWWRVKVANSGMYGIWRYNDDDFGTNLQHYSIEILDENNRIVEYDSDLSAWPLVAGKEYALRFEYQFKSDYTWNELEFWFQKEAEIIGRWVSDGGKWYYYEGGMMVKNAWRLVDGKWYFLNADGSMAANTWKKDSIGWVFLGKDGAMLTNAWCTDSQGWCYVGANGYAVTNCWKRDSVGWIWLNANGSMTKNAWVQDGGKWYFLNAEGYMVSNAWKKDSKGWVYLGSSGAMMTNAWVRDSVGWCYVGADGYAVTNCWKRDSVGWCYLNGNGSMTKSQWLYDGGQWYYLDANGYMVTGTRVIGGKTYKFNASGVWVG